VNVKVLDSVNGSGSFSWIINGIIYAALIESDVINMSLGATFDRINQGGGGAGPLLAALDRAVNFATAHGTLVVSAAGNEAVNLDSRLWSVPAQSGNGMAVSALAPSGYFSPNGSTNTDLPASYTNIGRSVISVGAPGGDARYPGNDLCFGTPCWVLDLVLSPAYVEEGGASRSAFAAGTSMAAPHVSGVAALIVGKYGKMSPTALRTPHREFGGGHPQAGRRRHHRQGTRGRAQRGAVIKPLRLANRELRLPIFIPVSVSHRARPSPTWPLPSSGAGPARRRHRIGLEAALVQLLGDLGFVTTALISRLRRSTISLGVPFGATANTRSSRHSREGRPLSSAPLAAPDRASRRRHRGRAACRSSHVPASRAGR
jgi:subtilisin family serine protease